MISEQTRSESETEEKDQRSVDRRPGADKNASKSVSGGIETPLVTTEEALFQRPASAKQVQMLAAAVEQVLSLNKKHLFTCSCLEGRALFLT